MWIFNCDRCNREDMNDDDGRRINGEYTATITVKLKTPNTSNDIINEAPIKYELCHECYNNLDWWMQKIDVIIPLISTAPAPLEQPLIIDRTTLETAPTLIPELKPE